MGPRVPFVSDPFGAISPNKVVKTKMRNKSDLRYHHRFSVRRPGYVHSLSAKAQLLDC